MIGAKLEDAYGLASYWHASDEQMATVWTLLDHDQRARVEKHKAIRKQWRHAMHRQRAAADGLGMAHCVRVLRGT